MTSYNQKLSELLSDDSFVRWIKGSASFTEGQHWNEWKKKDLLNSELCEHAEIFFQMQLELDPADDLDKQLSSLHQRISEDTHANSQTIFQRILFKNHSGRFRLSVAASIVIFLSILGFLSFYLPPFSPVHDANPQYEIAETAAGETSRLTFSDGSIIRLNENSSLRYSLDQFGSNQVDIWLKGEGHFDVASYPDGKSREFIVHTDDGTVNVLGTRFSMNTRFKKTSVVLEEGEVSVFSDDAESAELILKPGQRAVIDKSVPEITVEDVDPGLFSSWTQGKIEFENTPLKSVFTFIESAYNIKVKVDSSGILESEITGVIQNPDSDNLLSAIQNILDLDIRKVNDNEVFITHR